MQSSKFQIKIQNYLLPLIIIIVAGLIGANVLLGQRIQKDVVRVSPTDSQDLRLLSLKAPGMFCIGCSASMEGYLGAIEGVKSVKASVASKKVDVVYDPNLVGTQTILSNEILDAFGKEVISDEPFTDDSQGEVPSTTYLPPSLSFKLQEAAAKVSQLENPQDYQSLFDQIDQAIAQQDYEQAEILLDELLRKL